MTLEHRLSESTFGAGVVVSVRALLACMCYGIAVAACTLMHRCLQQSCSAMYAGQHRNLVFSFECDVRQHMTAQRCYALRHAL